MAEKIYDSVIEGIIITDGQGTILSVNNAFSELTGWSKDEATGKNPRILKSERHDRAFYDAMWNDLADKGTWEGELWNRRKDGRIFPEWLSIHAVMDGDTVSNYIASFRDLTEIKNREEAITWLSDMDPLTNLPNRVLFFDRLSNAIRHAERNDEKIAILYLDIKRFKNINASFGYHIGDSVLQIYADRLVQRLRKIDTVTHIGSDDFLVLLPHLKTAENAITVSEKILKALREPVNVGTTELFIDSSIGISFYPDDGKDPDSLIAAANTAMTRAKDSGSDSYYVFTPSMRTKISKRMDVERRLYKAVEAGSFTMYYQPKIDSVSHRVIGMEALIRWKDRDTIIQPGEFIPLAEENGLIVPIGEWALKNSLADLKRWLAIDPDLRLSVNLSAKQFLLPDVEDRIKQAIRSAGIPASNLDLEITESIAMSDGDRSARVMTTLADEGVTFSLDDFGTGYSSLYYLKSLPFQYLKVDQSFVRDIKAATDSPANSIVNTIIEMAHNLGLEAVAEGCETGEQLKFLTEHGCEFIQGYYFSRPVPAAEFESMVGKELAHAE